MSRILIVDDEPHICEALQDSLQADGYDVIVAHDGQTAIGLTALEAERGPIAGAIVDMEMPIVNGIEVLRRLRRQYPDLPILMVSANHDRKMYDEAMRSGANGYLPKPFSRKHLVHLCSKLFRCGSPIDPKPDS